ncbi:FkbM family methyltransferase [Anaerosacchariphilus polymeriproducens]|uniref:FkbM family methyltransferase n=1 Tax=Anaerosacchariphilus polymeriproducens TaxID=1812858 RepID=A0A371ATB8_9FIRM|nr:FkbM family methyltransferase [Anaerosacchariphilus polymeriproducens]RDU22811.1 FkbM family methyltransferase [Anaerosacchariphilus polymeriproducens]
MRKFDFDTWDKFQKESVGKKLVLFGAASGCRHFFEKKGSEFKISYIVDNDSMKWGKRNQEIDVRDPKVLKEENQEDIIVLIVSVHIVEIVEQLESLGVTNYYSWRFLNTNIKKEDTERYLKEFQMVESLLADEESKKVYKSVIEKRSLGIKDYRDIFSGHHYFPKGIIKREEEEIFVDCGAFDGDSIIKFKEWVHNNYKKIYAFEPTKETYQKLSNNFKDDDKINCMQAGVWEKETTLMFSENDEVAGANKISESGGTEIHCISLDDILGSEKVTFIKMDVEGAEQEAILGAQTIIKENKPKLAISIYHSLEDLWKVPLLIQELVPEYQLYIRHHDILTWETVVYAVYEK